jgi:hypothetical protein
MKTTRKTNRPANLNVVKLVDGDRWVQFETSKGRLTAWMTNSAGEECAVALDVARERMATLTGAGWSVAA